MKHPNVVTIYKILNYQHFLIISMSLGIESVSDFVRRRRLEGNPLTDEECSKLTRGLLSGLAYIHDEKNLIHRDIKEQNLILTQYQDLSQCQIIDFGIAVKNNAIGREEHGNAGTPEYQPPE